MRDSGPGAIVVLTALNLECEAVQIHLSRVTVRHHPAGTLFEVGSLQGSPRRIAVAAVGEGNKTAAVLTERAISLFRPEALLFVGVAGALKDDVALGDVVVGTRVYEFHGGRDEDGGFLARPRSWEAPHELEQTARRVARTRSWVGPLTNLDGQPAPTVHFAPIAAGEVIMDSRRTPTALHLRHHYNDAAAIEMESAGVAVAGHLNRSLPALTIRGISDTATGEKTLTDRLGWQTVAAAHAAAFSIELVRQLPPPRTNDRTPSAVPSHRPSGRTPATPNGANGARNDRQ
jgi:adenosylhomocysteine nucleosidase